METQGIEGLVTYLMPEGDEVAVLSLVTATEDESAHRLLRGSVLIGPAALAESNWHGWQTLNQVRPIGQPEPSGANYSTHSEGLSVVRAVLDVPAATAWLSDLASAGSARAAGIPEIVADLSPPVAPLRLSRHLQTDASTFITTAVRSATGFHLHGTAMSQDGPTFWSSGGGRHIDSPFAAGLPLKAGHPGGVVLARLERRAWFNSLRGGENLGTFDCAIGLDPDRIDVSDLAVTIDEWVEAELVHSQQLRLEEVEIDDVRGAPNITVQLPTLGSQVERALRLHDRHGVLLDGTARFHIAESIHIEVGLMGSNAPPSTQIVGEVRPTPALFERAEAVQRVRTQYQELFGSGADANLLPPNASNRDVLGTRLAQARGMLRVVDRYFGKTQDDWKMLDSVTVPTEVLTTFGHPPSSATNPLVTVRWLRPPPFHGRAYLWEDGGFSVDASPNGFGSAPIYIVPLSPSVSQRWQALFAGWWATASSTPPPPPPQRKK